jgi:hypothetical protein
MAWPDGRRSNGPLLEERERDEQGRFAQTPVSLEAGGDRDDESARGIRRRLVKRAPAVAALLQHLPPLCTQRINPQTSCAATDLRGVVYTL